MSLHKELKAVRSLREQLEAQEWDAESIQLAIQSETNFEEAIQALVDEVDELDMLAVAANEKGDALKRRSGRLKVKSDTLKTVILQAMELADLSKVMGPTCTISTKRMPKKVIITEEADIPSTFFKAQPPKLDKKALLKALNEGDVKGATLSNGGMTIQIRRD
ncbi:siphovirus Gp157 family protein [Curvivirga aplysinae]|uniref:siphovirus Gp157 family protein n=1 Tax=Curvivirga aplysinae TaxID=2529852 RepID=UPI001C3F941B|nr:siphovirus Gp157 family protein [Curvivirga aplysinae]